MAEVITIVLRDTLPFDACIEIKHGGKILRGPHLVTTKRTAAQFYARDLPKIENLANVTITYKGQKLAIMGATKYLAQPVYKLQGFGEIDTFPTEVRFSTSSGVHIVPVEFIQDNGIYISLRYNGHSFMTCKPSRSLRVNGAPLSLCSLQP